MVKLRAKLASWGFIEPKLAGNSPEMRWEELRAKREPRILSLQDPFSLEKTQQGRINSVWMCAPLSAGGFLGESVSMIPEIVEKRIPLWLCSAAGKHVVAWLSRQKVRRVKEDQADWVVVWSRSWGMDQWTLLTLGFPSPVRGFLGWNYKWVGTFVPSPGANEVTLFMPKILTTNKSSKQTVPCWGWENKSASLLKCDQFPRLPESGEKELSSLLVGGVHALLGYPNNIV